MEDGRGGLSLVDEADGEVVPCLVISIRNEAADHVEISSSLNGRE